MKKLFFALLLFSLFFVPAVAAEKTCVVYFTGVGCPHCSRADPVVLEEFVGDYPDLVVIEYEIYRKQSNAIIFYGYSSVYGSGYGIPTLVFGAGDVIIGDTPLIRDAPGAIEGHAGNLCPLLSGTVSFEELNLSTIDGHPTIWANGRVAFGRFNGSATSELLKGLLFEEDLVAALEGVDYAVAEPVPIPLSGKSVEFGNAVAINGSYLQWNGPGIGGEANATIIGGEDGEGPAADLTIAKILGLAAVDAVNPCALAVLSLMLIAIITYNPKNKRNVLLAGVAFTVSVFVMYLIYGLIIIRFFQLIQALTSIRLILYKVLGLAAIILGILNLKDFFWYTPGGLGTEMPMSLRPIVKKIISGVTSPRGAFVVGAFVTVFLLPCTIGPYVIAGGILSAMELLKTIPWLMLYNAIFVLPMLVITGVVYQGMASVENVSEWKDKNIKYLHLVAGAIILLLGVAMVAGFV
ncbi:MAG: hypothetical protein KAW41_01145 [Candidatus Diapherotrites archaeon]|nr:hypothetical protein [Candidatus Diapherotrites archaeon]